MRAVLTLALVAAATLLAVVPASTADQCTTYSTSEALIEDDGTYLVVDGLGGIHLYEETNGIEGLQRKDFGKDDTCGDLIPADEKAF